MQVVPSGGQICDKCKWHHLVAKFATDASGAMLLPNLVQVQFLGPLCLWQCFLTPKDILVNIDIDIEKGIEQICRIY